jgi:regulatory protein
LKKGPTLRDRALGLLARREYSRAELSRRLAPHAGSADELEALLDGLAGKSQLSDERYAEARAHTLSRKFGSARILHELKTKGIDVDLAQRVASAARLDDLQRAREVHQRKFRSPPAGREDRARQARFLQSRGFSFDVIRAVLKDAEEPE